MTPSEPQDPLMSLLVLLQRLDQRTESLLSLQEHTMLLSTQIEALQQTLREPRAEDGPRTPRSNSGSDLPPSWGDLLQQLSTALQHFSSVQRDQELSASKTSPLLELLPRLLATLARCEASLTERSELGAKRLETPLSSNEELLSELRVLWRKQELYVVGLRGSLQTDLETQSQRLMGQIREDFQGKLSDSNRAIAAAVRQAIHNTKPQQSAPLQAPPHPRPPLFGVVMLSSITSVVWSALMWWLLA